MQLACPQPQADEAHLWQHVVRAVLAARKCLLCGLLSPLSHLTCLVLGLHQCMHLVSSVPDLCNGLQGAKSHSPRRLPHWQVAVTAALSMIGLPYRLCVCLHFGHRALKLVPACSSQNPLSSLCRTCCKPCACMQQSEPPFLIPESPP